MDIRILLGHVGSDVRKYGQVPCLHQTLSAEALVLLPPPAGWVAGSDSDESEAEKLRCELALMRAERALKTPAVTAAPVPLVDARVSSPLCSDVLVHGHCLKLKF